VNVPRLNGPIGFGGRSPFFDSFSPVSSLSTGWATVTYGFGGWPAILFPGENDFSIHVGLPLRPSASHLRFRRGSSVPASDSPVLIFGSWGKSSTHQYQSWNCVFSAFLHQLKAFGYYLQQLEISAPVDHA
jgi:hypothetical protein